MRAKVVENKAALIPYSWNELNKHHCCVFGVGEDGVEFQAVCLACGRGRVIAVGIGKTRDEEGTKTVWRNLTENEQYLIDLIK